jgi:hypothetical protein
METADLASLDGTHLRGISTAGIVALSAAQIEKVQIDELSTRQIRAIETADIAALSHGGPPRYCRPRCRPEHRADRGAEHVQLQVAGRTRSWRR